MRKPTLLLVGCGKMGRALLDGWLSRETCGEIAVIEPAWEVAADRASDGGMRVRGFRSPVELPPGFRPDATVLAIKPQLFEEVLPAYRGMPGLVLSIAAGRTLANMRRLLEADDARPIVRAMPNTPASIGRGITAAVARVGTTAADRQLAEALLEAVGEIVWLDDETLIDAVTAVSGSGPAYVFLLIEVLAAAGTAMGLPPALAQRLARATVAGAGELARQSAEEAATLRRNVTSPNGTTAAALEILMRADGLAPLFLRAVEAATERSRQLAS